MSDYKDYMSYDDEAEYSENHELEELREELLKLKYEAQAAAERELSLKKENEKLYADLKDARYHQALFQTELENRAKLYEEELDRLIKEKNELQSQLDKAAVKVKLYDALDKTVTQLRQDAQRKADRLMDETQEKSMDAVTVIDFIRDDICRMKLDLENFVRSESSTKEQLDEEAALMTDLLNRHLEYLQKIKSGFYSMHGIEEYENAPEDFSVANRRPVIKNGSYVD